MKPAFLFYILRGAQAMMWLIQLMTGVMTLALAAKTYDLATTQQTEVRLRLDTFRPNLFGFWHDTQAGFEDGQRSKSREQRGPLAALPPTAGFELAADPHAPLLRYREPSAGKRAALLALGALDDGLSIAGLVFLGGSSWLLLGLLRDVTSDTPFTAANGRRLLWLALLLFGLNLWRYVAYALVWAVVPAYRAAGLAGPLSHYVRLNTDELVPGFEVGFILLIIAAVYQRGVALSREAELVI
ncbi:DUF2975 domain-containing protein [Hymenobacter sp. UV11]|uniref:DUF2975 domain-containing protein n=1 Tax=Hymenobacter sp. UV11 TaxID=1849735 RepID=UPI00105B2079|nr:DUF2975 domain-containing protein [Hymenobacter sp. UV11]TDN38970.1 hypothetical protein A8B98_20940 [Hymenobacter sp. UV11]TFZ65946.1 DUF2975 domain-containing protein [Hymenobacter sp. UV11]